MQGKYLVKERVKDARKESESGWEREKQQNEKKCNTSERKSKQKNLWRHRNRTYLSSSSNLTVAAEWNTMFVSATIMASSCSDKPSLGSRMSPHTGTMRDRKSGNASRSFAYSWGINTYPFIRLRIHCLSLDKPYFTWLRAKSSNICGWLFIWKWIFYFRSMSRSWSFLEKR